jgi:predicted enzyme related to lactoylglutathione lyase
VASSEEPEGAEPQLALNDDPAAKAYKQGDVPAGSARGHVLHHDVQADDERMEARGAEFTIPATDVTGSKIAKLNDTCGNLIQVTQLMGNVASSS